MRAYSRRLSRHDGYEVWELGLDRLEELTHFVFGVYYNHFASDRWSDASADLQDMLDDDHHYAPYATVFASVSPAGEILSTARAIEAGEVRLPIERDFGVPVMNVGRAHGAAAGRSRLFEIARLATSSSAIRQALIPVADIPRVTDAVVRQLICATCTTPGTFWLASMDNRALDLFRRRGFGFEQVGETNPHYIGSPTTPVVLAMDSFRADIGRSNPTLCERYFGQLTRGATRTRAPAASHRAISNRLESTLRG